MARTTLPLTDTQLRNAKPGDKEYPLSDGKGLFLLVRPNGSKLWRLRYAHPVTGSRKLLGIGQYPAMTLNHARQKRAESLGLLANGVDPQEHWKAAKAAEKATTENTLKRVAERWLTVKKPTVSADYADDIWRSLSLHVFPKLEDTPVAKLTAPTVIEVLRPLEAKGSLETLRRVCQRLNEIVEFGVHTGLLTVNPLRSIHKAFIRPEKQNLPSIKPQYLPWAIAKIQRANLSNVVRDALYWSLYTLARPNEASRLEWADIDFDAKLVRIPAERMKKRRDHVIPLTPAMERLLQRAQNINHSSPYVFSSPLKPGQPINSQTANAALKRSGLKGVLVSHGLRAVASTAMHEHGFNSDHIEKCLAHVEKNQSKAPYDRAEYINARRELLTWWCDFVDAATVRAMTGEFEEPALDVVTA